MEICPSFVDFAPPKVTFPQICDGEMSASLHAQPFEISLSYAIEVARLQLCFFVVPVNCLNLHHDPFFLSFEEVGREILPRLG